MPADEVSKEAYEAFKRSPSSNLYPVSAGEDIFAAVIGVSARVDAVLEHDVAQPAESDLRDVIDGAVRSGAFVDTAKALDRLLDVAIGEMHSAKRDDVVKLLADPLTTETRNTRRNLGLLTVLAVLVGFAGKAPDSLLGLGMASFPKWAFPLVLAVVTAYEFVAFVLYLGNDLESRRIHSDAARHDRDRLLTTLPDFERRERALTSFMSGSVAAELLRGTGNADWAANLAPKCSTLASQWRKDVSAFDREFRVQWRRRWWDVYMPGAHMVVSTLALLSLVPPLRLWLWKLFN